MRKLVRTIRLISKTNLSRGKVKELREAFYEGKAMVDHKIKMINSRIKDESDRIVVNQDVDYMDESYKILFDAIEIMDLNWGEIDEY